MSSSQALLRRARSQGTPLVDGESATFLWHGRHPPHLVGDFNRRDLEAPISLDRIGPGLWTHSRKFSPDAYIEYSYMRQVGKAGGGWVRELDPLNPCVTSNGMGDFNNFFYMPQAAPTSLTRRRRGVPRGVVTRHIVQNDFLVVGGKRVVYLYRPPTREPCPLVVVYDGRDYLRRAQLPVMVDNLIAQKRIRPVALAMLANGRQARFIEYACSEATLGFLVYCILPLARNELNLVSPEDKSGAYGVMGASMGGLMALYTGVRLPHIFGRVLSQSGAFTTGEHDQVIYDLIESAAVRPVKVWMDVGKLEWLAKTNRRMRDLLAARGYAVVYREYSGGHNYPAWRDDVWRGLEALFERDSHS